jgi:tetratricopeptide (TPR) repeat protein
MQSLKYIALSQNGLREKDLLALLDDHWDLLRFTSLRRWFRYLIIESESKQWYLGHVKLSEVLNSYLGHENISLHRDIANHFLSLPENDMLRMHETIYHLIKGDMKKEIIEYCIDIEDFSESYVIDAILQYYQNDYSALIYLANCITETTDNKSAILYAGNLVLGLNNRISKVNQIPLIRMARILFQKIDYNDCDIKDTRWIGEMSNQLSSACAHIKEFENMLYFAQIQEDCYKICIEHYKEDKDIQTFKNSLAMAFYKLGNYYSQTGDKKRALEYFDKMTNI